MGSNHRCRINRLAVGCAMGIVMLGCFAAGCQPHYGRLTPADQSTQGQPRLVADTRPARTDDGLGPASALTRPAITVDATVHPVEVTASLKPIEGDAGVYRMRMEPTTQGLHVEGAVPLQIQPATQPVLLELQSSPVVVSGTLHVDASPVKSPVEPGKSHGPDGKPSDADGGKSSASPVPSSLAAWLTFLGAGCFGIVIGWITYRSLRYNETAGLSNIATVIAAVGGAAVTGVFPTATGVFGAYCVGLTVGFFLYLLVGWSGKGPKWMGSEAIPTVPAGRSPNREVEPLEDIARPPKRE